ncbi:MAG: hypothetical protein IPL61_22755 [Myxococcales bacterium]|nr:hypothetical protein [Myxococcales bacterium]
MLRPRLFVLTLATACVVSSPPPFQPSQPAAGAGPGAAGGDASAPVDPRTPLDPTAGPSDPAGPIDPVGPGGASSAAVATGQAASFLATVPFQKWPVLGPRTEGLLITYRTSAGPTIGWSGGPVALATTSARALTYWFVAPGRWSAQAVYFASRGEGENFLAAWGVPLPDGKTATFDAAMFTPTTPNPWGLSAEAHLVDVDVNAGAGAAAGVHFVITGARVLDGQPGYPVAATALAQGQAAWTQWQDEQRTAIAALLDEQRRTAPGQAFGPETEAIDGGMFPEWVADRRVLRLGFYQRIARTSSKVETRMVAHSCPPGAPCLPPQQQQVTFARRYGVELALVVEIDARGLVAMSRLKPNAIAPSYDDPTLQP